MGGWHCSGEMDKRLKKEEEKILFVCVHTFFTHSQEALWPRDLCSLPGWMPFQRPLAPCPPSCLLFGSSQPWDNPSVPSLRLTP